MIMIHIQSVCNPLRSIALLWSLLLGLFAVSRNGAAGEWPCYRGSNFNGTSTETIQLKDWVKEPPRQIWKVPTPLGFSSFTVSQGKVFTLVGGKDDNGVDREICVALDANTGQELWRTILDIAKYDGGGDSGTSDNDGGDGPRSTPTVDGDFVYVYGSRLGLYCLGINDGKPVWQKDVVADFNGRNISWQSAASPLIVGELLYIPGGGEDQSFLALNKANGEAVWQGLDEMMTHATPIYATLHDIPQVIFFAQSGLVSVEAGSGKELWRHPYPYRTSTAASPVVFNDLVYCSAGYGIGGGLCRVEKNGDGLQAKEVWRTPNKTISHWSTPVCKDGYLYGMFSFKKFGEGPMKCIEMATGKEMWSQDGFGPGNCIVAGDDILALADDGHLVLVKPDPSAYTEVSRVKAVEGKCWSTPALSDSRVYIRSTKEGVCLDLTQP